MKQSKKIIVTGGAGFIGSNIIQALNNSGFKDIIVVDHIDDDRKKDHLKNLSYLSYFERDDFLSTLHTNPEIFDDVDIVIHMGACSNTTEASKEFLLQNNTEYSKALYSFCLNKQRQFIYASSAATYGDGSLGYNDNERTLSPLNYYGYSKYQFDEWVLDNAVKPHQWVGLKFFNVYGPNEDHKGRMSSVVFHGYHQLRSNGEITLFKSHKEGYEDGMQMRDFIYVKDVVDVVLFFISNNDKSGIYNVGTGKARTFYDLAKATFSALHIPPRITFIPMPEDLQEKYQYHTEANIDKLRMAGYTKAFTELEDGVKDYVTNYLEK